VLSLRDQLFGLWALLAVSAAVTAYLILQLYQQTATRQISEVEEIVGRACRSIADRYQFYTADWQSASKSPNDKELRQQLTNLVQTALLRISGVEGGIWPMRSRPTRAPALRRTFPQRSYRRSGK
jgi:hypothetical protein